MSVGQVGAPSVHSLHSDNHLADKPCPNDGNRSTDLIQKPPRSKRFVVGVELLLVVVVADVAVVVGCCGLLLTVVSVAVAAAVAPVACVVLKAIWAKVRLELARGP